VAGPIAVLLIALAAAAVIAAVLLAGGEEESPQKAKRQPAQQRQAPRREKAQAPAQVETTTTTTTTAGPAPSGAALNEQGFALMQRGDFAGALPVLRRAVASWPEDSTDLEYAYALFNLGATLNRTGHPDEAIPYLEKRLNWSNQRGVVKKELKLARQQAGG
jgi:tetratricopeptide (TPR) repeat protein